MVVRFDVSIVNVGADGDVHKALQIPIFNETAPDHAQMLTKYINAVIATFIVCGKAKKILIDQ